MWVLLFVLGYSENVVIEVDGLTVVKRCLALLLLAAFLDFKLAVTLAALCLSLSLCFLFDVDVIPQYWVVDDLIQQ